MASVQFGKLYPQADFIWSHCSVAAANWVKKGQYYHINMHLLKVPAGIWGIWMDKISAISETPWCHEVFYLGASGQGEVDDLGQRVQHQEGLKGSASTPSVTPLSPRITLSKTRPQDHTRRVSTLCFLPCGVCPDCPGSILEFAP